MHNPSHTPSEHHFPNEELCHYIIRVLDRISGKSSCMLILLIILLIWDLHTTPQVSIF